MQQAIVPFIVAAVLIAATTAYEGLALKDRWADAGVTAAEFGERFQHVPIEIGDWHGIDLPVDELVKNTAGAVNYVSRQYTHVLTGKTVTLWLIVGHSRDIVRHTPTVCYPASGFTQNGTVLKHHVDLPGDAPAVFFTAKFEKQDEYTRHLERVFWAWNHPDHNEWEAPGKPRFHYGLATKALYKLYFSSTVTTDENTIDDNACVEFAELMLPEINRALFPVVSGAAGQHTEPAADEAATEES